MLIHHRREFGELFFFCIRPSSQKTLQMMNVRYASHMTIERNNFATIESILLYNIVSWDYFV